jgi:DNA (cytosine-5)-methyltransferase 1
MPILSLCSGYEGIGLAVEALTGDTVAYVADVEEAAATILAHRFPDAPNIGDITAFDWTELLGLVDIITAGFPCQDISNAGKREGIDGDRSGIYRNVVEAIRVLRPRLVFLENVSAIRSRGLWQVVADLASVGYDIRWICLRASDVGAAHHRDRWFAVAYPADADGPRLEVGCVEPTRHEQPASVGGGTRADEPECRTCGCGESFHDHGGFCAGCSGCSDSELGRPEDADGTARVERGCAASGEAQEGGHGPTLDDEVSFLLPHADSVGWDGRAGDEPEPEGWGEPAYDGHSPAGWWGDYLPAIRRQERLSGRAAPAPTETGPRGGRRLTARFAEWLMWLPDGWVTAVPGLAPKGRDPRSRQLKAIGNGVVPAQAYEAFHYLLTLDTHEEEN